MGSVNQVLDAACQRLVLQLTRMMEASDAHPNEVARLRTLSQTAMFPADWPSMISDLHCSLPGSAYQRYSRWYESKRKMTDSPSLEGGRSSKRVCL